MRTGSFCLTMLVKARAKLVELDAPAVSPPTQREPRFGRWDHLGWKLPDNFDDPDLEIEALFHGDAKPDGEL